MLKPAHRPSLTRKSLWQTRRKHYTAVFSRALELLQSEEALPVAERLIVRKLHFKTVTARLELDPEGRYERPIFEAQNLPDPEFDEIETHENKVPDIQWYHDDPAAMTDLEREKAFVIECKCLGKTRPSGWNLNQQYVVGGVTRFHSPTWRYGNHMHEGMMIGFLQDMDMDGVKHEVDEHLSLHGFPRLKKDTQPLGHGLVQFRHQFDRTFPVSPFLLNHLWLDIRAVPKCPPKAK